MHLLTHPLHPIVSFAGVARRRASCQQNNLMPLHVNSICSLINLNLHLSVLSWARLNTPGVQWDTSRHRWQVTLGAECYNNNKNTNYLLSWLENTPAVLSVDPSTSLPLMPLMPQAFITPHTHTYIHMYAAPNREYISIYINIFHYFNFNVSPSSLHSTNVEGILSIGTCHINVFKDFFYISSLQPSGSTRLYVSQVWYNI